jgi:tetratricopeptide (TPR) repeat protein
MMQLAESYRAAGRTLDAAKGFEDAYDVLVSIGRGDTETAGTFLNNWALTMLDLGQPREAERLFRRAVEIASADGTDTSVSPMLLTNLARPLMDLGRYREAADIADRASVLATAAGYTVVYNQGLLLRAALYRELGDVARAGALLDEFAARASRDIPPGHMAHDVLVIDRGRLAAARGDTAAAAAAFDRAIAALDVPDDEIASSACSARSCRGRGCGSTPASARRLADANSCSSCARRATKSAMNCNLGRAWLVLGRRSPCRREATRRGARSTRHAGTSRRPWAPTTPRPARHARPSPPSTGAERR